MVRQIAPFYFEKALNTQATAWICHGMELPLAAEDFLFERKIAIPKELSFMAMHSTQRIEGLNITAFELCFDRMGYLAAHCILGDIPMNKNGKGLIEYEWKLKVRKTVGQAKGEER